MTRGIRTVQTTNLRNFDLNLLRLFKALWEQRSIGRAAKSIGLTQPAASNALKRMRDALGDPLFVLAQGRMIPTELAQDLSVKLLSALATIDQSLSERRDFDPLAWNRVMRIGVTDYAMATMAGKVLPEIIASAPKGSFQQIVMRERNPHDDLRDGRMDIAIGSFTGDLANFYQFKLHIDSFVVIASKNYPGTGKKTMDLKPFVDASHCLIAPWGNVRGQVDERLEGMGLSRQIAATVPYFHSAPEVIARTQLISTVPKSLAEQWAKIYPIIVRDPPKELELKNFTIFLLWHQRTHDSAAHRWVRQFYIEASRK